MSVCYQKPTGEGFSRWCDHDGRVRDVWYERDKIICINGNNNSLLPQKLRFFLQKWRGLLHERYDAFREEYPVRDAHIEFILEGEVYNLIPRGVGAMYKEPLYHMGVELYLECHALFERYHSEIIKDLQETLHVQYAKYFGYLD